ncbi:hypothetical protein ACFOFO_19705 [Undibacterium arcticum]|uniref:Uncharacterized protein n=2 Tax=Undibacterium arcticum TaxID=1762892 RepID=A0ABV7F7K1_9BURK
MMYRLAANGLVRHIGDGQFETTELGESFFQPELNPVFSQAIVPPGWEIGQVAGGEPFDFTDKPEFVHTAWSISSGAATPSSIAPIDYKILLKFKELTAKF